MNVILSLVIVVAVGVAWWLVFLLADPFAREHRYLRRNEEELLLKAGEIERAGDHVRDLSMNSVNTRRQSAKLWIPPVVWLLGGALVVALGASTGWTAVVVGLWFGVYGVFDEFTLPMFGHHSYAVDRERGEWKWVVLGALSKAALAVVSCWVLFEGVARLIAGRFPDGVQAVAVGYLFLANSHWVAVWCARRARQMHRPTFAADADENTVLLLRSFSDDELRMRTMLAVSGLTSPPLPMAFIRFEEQLAVWLTTMGRLVAIGRPGEALPELGAARTYWADDQWQEAVQLTANKCRAIVLIAGASAGLAWELERLRAWKLLGKTLVVLPPDRNLARSAERYRRVVGLLAPGSQVKFDAAMWVGLRVRPDGRVIQMISDGRDWASYSTALAQFMGELSGRIEPLEHGTFAGVLDRIDRVVVEADSVDDGMARWQSGGPAAKPVRQRATFSQSARETLPIHMAARFAHASKQLGVLLDEERFGAAEAVAGSIVELVVGHNVPGILALALGEQAAVLTELGRHDDAEKLLERAQASARAGTKRVIWFGDNHTPLTIEMKTLEVWTWIAEHRQDDQQLLNLLDQIVVLADESGDATMVGTTQLRAATHLSGLKQWDAAAFRAQLAVDVAVNTGNTELELDARWRMAACHNANGEWERTLQEMQRCVAVADQRGDIEGGILARAAMSQSLRRLGRNEMAFDYCRQAAALLGRSAGQDLSVPRQALTNEIGQLVEAGHPPAGRLLGELRR